MILLVSIFVGSGSTFNRLYIYIYIYITQSVCNNTLNTLNTMYERFIDNYSEGYSTIGLIVTESD